jgi:hypothetical protein
VLITGNFSFGKPPTSPNRTRIVRPVCKAGRFKRADKTQTFRSQPTTKSPANLSAELGDEMRATSRLKTCAEGQGTPTVVIQMDSQTDNQLDNTLNIQMDSQLDNQTDIHTVIQNPIYRVQHAICGLHPQNPCVKVRATWIKPNPALRQGRARAPNGSQQKQQTLR